MDALKRHIAVWSIVWMFWSVIVTLVFLFLSRQTIDQWDTPTRCAFLFLGPMLGVIIGGMALTIVETYFDDD